jgi:hypothetical protein
MAQHKKVRKQENVTLTTDDDPLFDLINENWEQIISIHQLFADRKPIMLYDVQERRIYAYPYAEFQAELNPRSQRILSEQYQQAIEKGQIVVFVRDNQRRKLVSYSIQL